MRYRRIYVLNKYRRKFTSGLVGTVKITTVLYFHTFLYCIDFTDLLRYTEYCLNGQKISNECNSHAFFSNALNFSYLFRNSLLIKTNLLSI